MEKDGISVTHGVSIIARYQIKHHILKGNGKEGSGKVSYLWAVWNQRFFTLSAGHLKSFFDVLPVRHYSDALDGINASPFATLFRPQYIGTNVKLNESRLSQMMENE